MKWDWGWVVIAASSLFLMAAGSPSGPDTVEVRPAPDRQAVEVWVSGRLFTAFQYGTAFAQKPVFYPILSPDGAMINRELPFIKESHETSDHPHHQSLFLGYGNVSGLDFWSTAHGERIVYRATLETRSGDTGELDFAADWQDPQGRAVLREFRRVTFGSTEDSRWMDHDITLQALDEALNFNDTKEGMLGLRLADALREEGGTGRYQDAFGREGSAEVWGKRSPWVALRGELEGKPVTVAIYEHPSTSGHPSYWHARGYGLFAVNPFGRKDFVQGARPLDRRLEPGQSFHFRWRIWIYGGKVAKERLDKDYSQYIE